MVWYGTESILDTGYTGTPQPHHHYTDILHTHTYLVKRRGPLGPLLVARHCTCVLLPREGQVAGGLGVVVRGAQVQGGVTGEIALWVY